MSVIPITEDGTVGPMPHGGGEFLAQIGGAGNLGGGSVAVEWAPNGGTFVKQFTFDGTEPSQILELPRGQIQFVVQGSTSPDFNIEIAPLSQHVAK